MPKLWMLLLCCAFITMSLASTGSCLSPHFTDNGYGMVANPNIIQAVFGKKDRSAILGFLSAFNSIGGSLSPMINGAVFDHTGSYTPAFFIWSCLIPFVIITFIAVILSENKTKA